LAGLQGFVRELGRVAPDAHADVVHVVAEGDMVVIHSHTQRNPQDRGMAQVDIFRVHDGKISEHWDVIQPIPETSVSGNGMF
jgi:predicted SnoaL-like aldol condensation-catalyzing enzyme